LAWLPFRGIYLHQKIIKLLQHQLPKGGGNLRSQFVAPISRAGLENFCIAQTTLWPHVEVGGHLERSVDTVVNTRCFMGSTHKLIFTEY
jgi:hypothetical protein